MRIIAGAYKGRNLKSPPSLNVRPTSDRLRETLFNVIAPLIEDARFLDLCAGSGAVGIEAISRGASHVTFVDRSRRMCKLIEANVELCRIPEEQFEIYRSEANEFFAIEGRTMGHRLLRSALQRRLPENTPVTREQRPRYCRASSQN